MSVPSKKELAVKNIYVMVAAYLDSIQNFRKVQELKKKMKEQEALSKINKTSKVYDEFLEKSKHLLDDVEKTEELKNGNLSNLKLLLDDSQEVVSRDILDRILNEVSVHEIRGDSKIEEVLTDLEKESGIPNTHSKGSSKDFDFDDYFLEMATTYSNIAKGLEKTIMTLDSLIDELTEKINLSSAQEADMQTESKPVEEKAEAVKAETNNKSVEDIEMGFDGEDYFEVNDEMDNDAVEAIEGESEDLSGGLKSLFGESEEEPDNSTSNAVKM